MTQHLSQSAIDAYREVFYVFARRGTGTLEDAAHLRYVLRNAGFSPTLAEAQAHWEAKKGRLDFPAFLDVLHRHSQTEDPRREILKAFEAHDRQRTGSIPAKELRSVLGGIGERLSQQEIDRLFAEAGIRPTDRVPHQRLLDILTAPQPDYL